MPLKDLQQRAAYRQAHYRANRATLLARAKAYQRANKEQVRARAKACGMRPTQKNTPLAPKLTAGDTHPL